MSEFVRICRFLSEFVGFRNDAFSRCKVTKKDFGTVSLCQFVSVYVTLCHFPIHSLFLDAKLQKVNLALSPFVSFCHYLSPFVTFCHLSANCFFTMQSYEKKSWHCPHLSAYVRPEMSAFVRFRHSNVSYCRCKVTKKYFGIVTLVSPYA